MSRFRRAGGMFVAALLLAGAAASPSLSAAAASPGPTAAPGGHGAYSEKGADTCLGCHDDPAVTVIFQGRHAQPGDPRTPFGHGGLQCEACHGPGGAHVRAGGQPLSGIVDFGKHALASVPKQNSMCLGCHEQNAAHDWASGPHAASNLACADCHTLHTAKDPVFVPATQIEVCTTCHQAEHSDLFKPSHHPLREGKMACTSCHSPHGSTAPAQLVRNTVNETCTTCHAEFRGPFLWEHQPVSEDCSTCHDPHGSTQLALLKVRTPFLCQECHEGAGHPSIVNTPQGLPGGGMPSAYLLAGGCINCHSQVHGSNHPSGRALMR